MKKSDNKIATLEVAAPKFDAELYEKMCLTWAAMEQAYKTALAGTESFEVDNIGADLAYLLGAMLTETQVTLARGNPLLEILEEHVNVGSPIWDAIRKTEEVDELESVPDRLSREMRERFNKLIRTNSNAAGRLTAELNEISFRVQKIEHEIDNKREELQELQAKLKECLP
ncbi:MAG: hypothetical protein EHM87_21685 [Burkholderiales bacterium]|nr:MAG: hypothetical protein EHM87_21685 [Burkholderiales bacterium]